MKLNPHIFREYDIRGVVGKELNAETAELIGKGFGSYIQKASGKNLAIGRDNRLSSEELKNALVRGLLSTGCNVTDIGISLSPMLYFAVCNYGFDGGVNVTGSHNPKEFNGFKLTKKEAVPVFGKEIQEIKKIIEKEKFLKGKGELKRKDGVGREYLEMIKSKISLEKKMKIVIDCGNGTASLYAPKLLEELGCKVIELYCESDGNFPNHLPDPEEEKSVKELMESVRKEKADLGIAFDGDGDRIGMVDEQGKRYEADYLLLLLVRDLLSRKPGSKIVFEVKCSENLEREIKARGGKPLMWKAGHSLIKQKMREEKALLGGEVSGHMFFAENYYGFDDALYAAAKILEYHSRSDKKFSEHFKDIPRTFHTPELKLACPDERKFEVVEEVKKNLMKKFECIAVDGVRIKAGEGNWALIRASNTNPYLTVRFEAKTKEKLAELKELVRKELEKFREVNLSNLDN